MPKTDEVPPEEGSGQWVKEGLEWGRRSPLEVPAWERGGRGVVGGGQGKVMGSCGWRHVGTSWSLMEQGAP